MSEAAEEAPLRVQEIASWHCLLTLPLKPNACAGHEQGSQSRTRTSTRQRRGAMLVVLQAHTRVCGGSVNKGQTHGRANEARQGFCGDTKPEFSQ